MDKQDLAYQIANSYLGLKEWPGAKHNETIVNFYKKAGHPEIKDDETPWCAAFVGAVLAEAGLTGTGALAARSYLKWGEAVSDISEAEPGDVVVFWRGAKDGWQGHVGFFVRPDGDKIMVLGGNQGNAVSIAAYPKSRLLGIRRAKKPKTAVSSTTIQAAAVTAVSGAGGVATAIGSLDGTAQIVLIVLAFVGLAGLGWIARERIKKLAAGV